MKRITECWECGGELKEIKFIDFGFLLINKAVVHYRCKDCNKLHVDVVESREYASEKRFHDQLKQERLEKRKISLFGGDKSG